MTLTNLNRRLLFRSFSSASRSDILPTHRQLAFVPTSIR